MSEYYYYYKHTKKACDGLGLTMEAAFVPQSKSRHAGRVDMSLNWKIRLGLNGGSWFLETDYSQGIGHVPGYQSRCTLEQNGVRLLASEKGMKAKVSLGGQVHPARKLDPPGWEVIESLLLDFSSLDCAAYEEWAAQFGYDQDSRKGEKIYQESLGIALKMRQGLGEAGLIKLREALDKDNNGEGAEEHEGS